MLARGGRAFLWTITLVSWFLVYSLSFAPATVLAIRLGWQQDTRMVLAEVAYAPVYWLLVNTPIHNWQPISLYFNAW